MTLARREEDRRNLQVEEEQGAGIGSDTFVETKEHRRFEQVCRDATRYRYVAVCVGVAGVGKTVSGRRYSSWDLLEPVTSRYAYVQEPPPEVVSHRASYYCVPPANTPKMIANEIELRRNMISWLVDVAEEDDGGASGERWVGIQDHTELVIIDEAQFLLKHSSLEQLRYIYDHGDFGLVLMGMPGLDKSLAHYKQFYSRIGQLHTYRTLDLGDVGELLQQPALLGTGLSTKAFPEEVISQIMRVCKGNFRTLKMLTQRIERILEINERQVASAAIVRKASEQLLPGVD